MAQQHELDASRESEEFLGNLVSGIAGRLGEGESEAEFEEELAAQTESEDELEAEDEFEGEYEAELEYELEALLGQGEEEDEALLGGAAQFEDEFLDREDESEEFFKGLRRGLRGLGRFVRRGARVLRPLAKVAAPLVGTAIGGPLGGLAGTALSSLLEGEFEEESEAMANPLRRVYPDAMMEHLGHAAAEAETEAEAEAFIGALVPLAAGLARSAAPMIARATPQLVRGLSRVTRTLRRNPASRRLVRVLPTIVTGTTRSLARQVARGRPITAQRAVRTLAGQTAAALSNPRVRNQALRRSRALDRCYHRATRTGQLAVPARSATAVRALAPRPTGYRPGYRPRPGYGYAPGYPRRQRYAPALSVAWVPVPAMQGGYPSPGYPC
jgi:hypothetical protein